MSAYDLIFRGGTLVTAEGPEEADLAVEDGRIAAISPDLEGTAREEVDATGLHLLPGAIDAHATSASRGAPTGKASRRAPERSRRGA